MNRVPDQVNLFAELGFKVGAEIGVDRGYFSADMCQANPGVKLYGKIGLRGSRCYFMRRKCTCNPLVYARYRVNIRFILRCALRGVIRYRFSCYCHVVASVILRLRPS